jgi:hypothetical protein
MTPTCSRRVGKMTSKISIIKIVGFWICLSHSLVELMTRIEYSYDMQNDLDYNFVLIILMAKTNECKIKPYFCIPARL